MDSAQAALERLCDPVHEVSAHYLIGADGAVWQMVREHDRAWHAGAGEWHGYSDINSRSIGIELDNAGTHPFAEPQMAMLELLLNNIMARWDIAPQSVIGHSDMAPGRKADPGPCFDWQRLERQALAAPRGVSHPYGDLRALARARGYTAPIDDATLLAAIRLRYRPWAKGPLQAADLTALA